MHMRAASTIEKMLLPFHFDETLHTAGEIHGNINISTVYEFVIIL